MPLFALARTALGYVLLDRRGGREMADRFLGVTRWGPADRLSRITRGRPDAVRRAESDLRRLALARALPIRLSAMLSRHLPAGVAYLNVGHSNLTDRVFQAVRQAAGGRVSVMIHDVIPLEFPGFQRPGEPERFAAKLRRVGAAADLVLYNTADTRRRAEAQLRRWGAVPPALVAHLGVTVPSPGRLPPGIDRSRPWFAVLGTIEPRKGHDLLLDVWDDLAARLGGAAPQLLICGARGWNNDAVFDRLDRLPADGPVRELGALADPEAAAVLRGARALLFPSRAEGFGLPPAEAAALGVPVVCSDLPAVREVLGDIPVYLEETDRYQWRNTIESLMKGRMQEDPGAPVEPFVPPTWQDHFKAVLRFT